MATSTALDQHGRARARRVAEAAALDHAQASRMAGVEQQAFRHADSPRELHALVDGSAHHDRRAGLVHRVQIQEVFGRVDEGPQLARAPQLRRVARPEQPLVGPDPVVVLVDVARAVRVVEVEARIGGDIGERDGQLAGARLQTIAQQRVERNCAAELVAVRQCLDHHARTRLAGVEDADVLHAGVVCAIPRKVRR
jgi:hypothetical protein